MPFIPIEDPVYPLTHIQLVLVQTDAAGGEGGGGEGGGDGGLRGGGKGGGS